MAPKSKQAEVENKVEEEPVPKKAKTDEEDAEDVEIREEVKKVEEQDDQSDDRPSIKNAVSFDTAETTLNVVSTNGGKVLMLMADGGMQFLVAGARANVGMKAGRYFYEVNILEALAHHEGQHNRSRTPQPAQFVRVGFSIAGSSLILGDTVDSVSFDSQGAFISEKKSQWVSQKFHKGQTVGVLLNLDAKSPNANTVSLFRDGVRICEPQALPEQLKGKILFPHVSFRNVSLQTHFGPAPMAALPFKCRSLGQAAQADVQVAKVAAPKDGKYDVLFPVGFPDEGTFTWLDSFLEKNPQYVELSDRAIQNWIIKSGMWKQKGGDRGWSSNDKPQYNFGLSLVDDQSIRRAIMSVAPLVPRHYVVMEVKQNLVAEDRKTNLQRFNLPHFKKIAKVMMGEPSKEYKDKVYVQMLEDKQTKSDKDWKQQKLEKERKKAIAKRQKELKEKQALAAAEAKKRREAAEAKRQEMKEAAEAKKKEAEDKKKAEEAAKKAEEGGDEKKIEEPTNEQKDVEMKTDDKLEEKKEDEKKEEPKEEAKEEPKEEAKEDKEDPKEEEAEDDDMGTEPPKVGLTDEDKKVYFLPAQSKDLLESVLSHSFGQFSIPEKSEGFDEIKFEWQNAEKAGAYLNTWRLEKKISSRIDDLQIGEWFKITLAEFQKTCEEYQAKQKEYKAKAPKASVAKPQKAEGEEEDAEEKKPDVDIFEVKDVCDVGEGEPLFSNFTFEDWTVFTLRYELYLLIESFKKDVNDAERVGIHESLFNHYYSKYFRKTLSPKLYGKDNLKDLIADFVKDTVGIDASNGVLVCSLAADASREASDFLKLQEESRRERQRRIDAGDETVRINFDGLKKQIEQEKQRAIAATAKAEADKKRDADNKVRAEAAKKAQLEAAKRAALEPKPAAGQPVKWGAAAQDDKKATWNSSSSQSSSSYGGGSYGKGSDQGKGKDQVKQSSWSSAPAADKGGKGGGSYGAWSAPAADKGTKGGGKSAYESKPYDAKRW